MLKGILKPVWEPILVPFPGWIIIVLLIFFWGVTPSYASDKVSLQLAWKHQFQFAGYYAALHKGYYDQAGLDVTIVEGGEGKFAREAVRDGRAQYGVAGSELLLHRKDGDPFVVLAPVFQHSPSILLVRRSSGITHLQDLTGKKVMLLPGKKDADILAAFLNEGISLNSIQRLDQSYNLKDLIQGHTDAVSAYTTNEPWLLLQENVEPFVISPRTCGVDFYSDCLFTTEQELEGHPHRVKQFLKASIKGWKYAMDHPDEIIDILLDGYNVGKKRQHLRFEAESIRKIMLPDLVQIGHMNPGRWHHIAETYEKLGLIEANFPLDGFLYDPNPKPDLAKFKRIVSVAIAVIFIMSLGTGLLLFFNRKLTAEVYQRKKAEKELRKSERELQRTLDATADGIWSWNFRTDEFNFSPRYYQMLGYAPDEFSASFENWRNLIHPDDRENALKKVNEYLKTKPDSYKNTFRLRTKAGDYRWIKAVAKVVERDENETAVYMIGHHEDITEHKKMEEQLIQTQKMESIGRLAGGIAHEFNNILSIIIGNNELVMANLPESSLSKDSAEEIQLAGLRARDVVKHLLTFSRQDNSTKKPINIGQVVKGALKLIRSATPQNIKIRDMISPDCHPVFGDSTQINQILINLCNNAADALSISGGIIDIELCNTVVDQNNEPAAMHLKPGKYIKLLVKDNGSGMDKATLDRIFDPYFTTKEVGEGSGIGLAVVHGIVKNHGGKIACESTVNQGSTFTILIPVHDGLVETEPEPKNIFSGKGESILYVDDEPSIANLGRRHLETLGYDAFSTTDPEEALELIKSDPGRFALIISDMAMPNMPGDQLISEILAVNPGMPVIICTGYSSRMSETKALEMGVKAIVMKPLSKPELAEKVRKVLDDSNQNEK